MSIPEVICVGRVSVDLYGVEMNVGFDGPQSFTKSVGGSPTNVAVAAARLGRRAAIVTKVGGDGFGTFVRNRLAGWGVTVDHVGIDPQGQTPLALTALAPAETPQVAFYRGNPAPDTTLVAADLDPETVRNCGVLWISHGALAQGTTASAAMTWLEQRGRAGHTILDLDYRPALWPDLETSRRASRTAIGLSTVVIGNLDECEMALGTRDPETAAAALLGAGVELAVIKLGGDGVYLAAGGERWTIAPIPVAVVSGLGAGDAFGGALSHGLLNGWAPERIGHFANAAGALVASRLACAEAMPTLEELESMFITKEKESC
ncbi:5-dehydro-2-deoxygluconokinase [Pseudarthrobacter sp. H2]|uniref:5-dehydro-2-deoxygluconokinase n=1 Tax=Pseudarthrobacter sp. H2 TaxID=3418415 RepID=UPI003CE75023